VPAIASLNILIVDDQASMRQLMTYSLEQLGAKHIIAAKNGAEALDKLKTAKFDMIISDWNMDNIDGLELLKFVRANPLISKMPFIMATGNKDKQKVRTAVQSGVNNYVVKPFTVNQLKSKIEAVVGPLT
jgi:two-component system chemotaxis response regulator CheY